MNGAQVDIKTSNAENMMRRTRVEGAPRATNRLLLRRPDGVDRPFQITQNF